MLLRTITVGECAIDAMPFLFIIVKCVNKCILLFLLLSHIDSLQIPLMIDIIPCFISCNALRI